MMFGPRQIGHKSPIQKERDRYVWEGEIKSILTGLAERLSNTNNDVTEIKEHLGSLPDEIAKTVAHQLAIRDYRLDNLERRQQAADEKIDRLISSDTKHEAGNATYLKTATWASMLIAAWAAIVGAWYQMWPKK